MSTYTRAFIMVEKLHKMRKIYIQGKYWSVPLISRNFFLSLNKIREFPLTFFHPIFLERCLYVQRPVDLLSQKNWKFVKSFPLSFLRLLLDQKRRTTTTTARNQLLCSRFRTRAKKSLVKRSSISASLPYDGYRQDF